ncbi:MAG TPA: hypothetical protein VHQ20_02010, partial [Patescibacteria group bacterium]|nr:hypothetical protein [Patescibacteria group bacterium]
MITLLLGTDQLAKKEYIAQIGQKLASETVFLGSITSMSELAKMFEPQLFGAPKLVVLNGVWKDLEGGELMEVLGDNKSVQLVIVEDTLDKRKKVNTEFLKDKRVTVVQFDSPVGVQASAAWITKMAKEKGVALDGAASMALARALLVDEDSVLNVVRAQNELQKLSAYAGDKVITAEMVGELTENVTGVDVFELLNAIATKNKKLAMQMLDDYFETETADEKTNAIKVAALLSDQFRSLLITLDAGSRNMPDEKLLDLTGWKSGRLYIMKRLSRNFTAVQTKQALAKLENLDRELKTG